MRTILVNGSPKKNINESNTEICIREFTRKIKEPCTVRYINKEDPRQLAKELEEYDIVLFFLPLYIHAMPGTVMRFIEVLDRETMSGKYLGFFTIAGFPETAQEQYVMAYYKELAAELGCHYLGTVAKGETAGMYMMPKSYKKFMAQLNELGMRFEREHQFPPELVKEISYPYRLQDYPRHTRIFLKIGYALGISKVAWVMMLRKNKAYRDRRACPYL